MGKPTKVVTADDFSPYRVAQFWSQVRLTPTGCMLFEGGERTRGYDCVEMRGRTSRSHRRCLAHRAAYAMTWGECPALPLLHSCDTPRCVNPQHLRPGTIMDNVRDMVSKGRHKFFGRVPKEPK